MKKLSEIEITEEIKEKASQCATAEEIAALAQEYGAELTKEETDAVLKYNNRCKELSADDIDRITGGEKGDDRGQHLPPEHRGQRISKYAEGYVGRKVYCVQDNDPEQFCWGILQASREYGSGLWLSYRVHTILIQGWNRDTDKISVYKPYEGIGTYMVHVPVGQVMENIEGDFSTLFLYV